MSTEVDQEVVDHFADMLGMHFEICTDYSGRSMYGRTCIGIVTDSPEYSEPQTLGDVVAGLFDIACEFADSGDPDWSEIRAFTGIIRSMAIDSLGKGQIIYFPAARTS